VLRREACHRLTEARHPCAGSGYFAIAPSNHNPHAHHAFDRRGLQGGRADATALRSTIHAIGGLRSGGEGG